MPPPHLYRRFDVERVTTIKAVLAGIIAALTALWGWFGWLVLLYIFSLAIDYLTGSMAAMKRGAWCSQRAREGIWHKAGSIIVVIVAGDADILLGTLMANIPGITISYSVLLCPVVIVWYILTELGSIIENAAALGAPVPAWLAKRLSALKNTVDELGGGTEK